jgi:hypothetical protein
MPWKKWEIWLGNKKAIAIAFQAMEWFDWPNKGAEVWVSLEFKSMPETKTGMMERMHWLASWWCLSWLLTAIGLYLPILYGCFPYSLFAASQKSAEIIFFALGWFDTLPWALGRVFHFPCYAEHLSNTQICILFLSQYYCTAFSIQYRKFQSSIQ